MMILFWMALVVLACSLGVLAALALRHLPQVRTVNVASDDQAKARAVKEEIILRRVVEGSGTLGTLWRALVLVGRESRRGGRRLVHHLRALEDRYQDLKRRGSREELPSTEMLKHTLEEAATLVRDEEYAQAEKKYIEVISLHPRLTAAYEHLGRLYGKMKQYDQAVETLKFALKLSPKDASVHASLGEIYTATEQWQLAMQEFQTAVRKRAANAKYLDGYIESALDAKRPDEAAEGMALLRNANPENQKFAEWEERLTALRSV